VDDVGRAVQDQDADLSQLSVDDPMLGNAGLGVPVALRDQVALAVALAFAHHFHHEVGALREVLAEP
jgi:hypothetical protein